MIFTQLSEFLVLAVLVLIYIVAFASLVQCCRHDPHVLLDAMKRVGLCARCVLSRSAAFKKKTASVH